MKNIKYNYKPQNFIDDVIILYQNAKKLSVNNKQEKIVTIKRGRSHSIASQLEDLFAYFLYVNLKQYTKEQLFIFIDQKMILEKNKSYFYPDIAIVYKNKIIAMFDLKTDLGYKRDSIIEDCRKKENFVQEIKNNTVKITDGCNKKIINYFEFSNNIIYDIVVLSDLNIPKKNLLLLKDALENLNTKLYFLTSKEHPNYYVKKKEIEIEENNFNQILEKIIDKFI